MARFLAQLTAARAITGLAQAQPALPAAQSDAHTGAASGVDDRFSTAPVPEPGMAALLLAGLGIVLRRARVTRLTQAC